MRYNKKSIYEKTKTKPTTYTEIVHQYRKDQITYEAMQYLKNFIDEKINQELYRASLKRERRKWSQKEKF